ncbi:MAG TPA: class I SAM-dependent methyltransferase [Humisphaera sp.]|nr:class I SAM-dependent methyltransferase [Humisphaera sp.]
MTDRQPPPQYSADDPVVAQYERWLYPAPANDLRDPAIAQYVQSYGTLESIAPIYWPDGSAREDLDVLVAGCGTMGAACYALLNPKCRITGIDISRAALAHEQRLKEHHRLDNLTLQHCPIEQVGSLKKSFDFIACQGVLHHMPDPAAGLRALRNVLRTDGVIAIMLYAKYGRTGVYMLQDLFRTIGVEQTPQGVAVVRETLANLPADHPVQIYMRHATDLTSDAGLVDTFLHRRDKCYSVADCVSLVNEAGLIFQGWDQNFFYYPEGVFQRAPSLQNRITQLPDEKIWEAMDLAFGAKGVHYFHVCRRERDPGSYRIPWNSPRLLDCIPTARAQLGQVRNPSGQSNWALVQPNAPPVLIDEACAAMFSHFDGRRTLCECAMAAGVREQDDALVVFVDRFFKLVWRCGFATLRLL